MDCKSKNSSIRCTVKQCEHNMGSENYCTLNTIDVGTHESNPTMPECTDCNSFVKKNWFLPGIFPNMPIHICADKNTDINKTNKFFFFNMSKRKFFIKPLVNS